MQHDTTPQRFPPLESGTPSRDQSGGVLMALDTGSPVIGYTQSRAPSVSAALSDSRSSRIVSDTVKQ